MKAWIDTMGSTDSNIWPFYQPPQIQMGFFECTQPFSGVFRLLFLILSSSGLLGLRWVACGVFGAAWWVKYTKIL